MLVTFQSWMGPPSEGFTAGYTTEAPVWCTGTTEITADTMELTDGSFGFNYHNGQLCRWKITKASGGPLTLYFRSFETEEGKDVLKIYDFSSSELLATLSGQYDPDTLPPPVTVESGIAFLIFTSNSSVTDKGWEIYYPKSTEGMEEKGNRAAMQVYPNPASDQMTVVFNAETKGMGEITIMTAEGRVLRKTDVPVVPGRNVHQVDVTDLPSGIYLLQLRDQSGRYIQKFVVI
jgi:hypothetical protein